MDKPFIMPLDDTLIRLACLVSVVGALCIRLLGWEALGWLLMAFAMLSLWLAYQFAAAPLCDDPMPLSPPQDERSNATARVSQD